MTRYFKWAGGRKTGLGLIGVVLSIPMARLLGASFYEWAAFVAMLLGFTQFSVAYEDRGRKEI